MNLSTLKEIFDRWPEETRAGDFEGQLVRASLHRAYGEGVLPLQKAARLRGLCARFLEEYGDGPAALLRSPARINILGEHIDYVSYLPASALTFASREQDMMLLFRRNPTGKIRGASCQEGFRDFVFNLHDEPVDGFTNPADTWEQRLPSLPKPASGWSNYVRGAVLFARWKYREKIRSGMDFIVDSTIPPAAGASSSSALTVLAGAAIRQANHLAYDAADLAHDSARAEWYVGTRGGAMDHLTLCCAQPGRSVRIDFDDGTVSLFPFGGIGVRWVTLYTHPADKGKDVMLEYNERAAVARLVIPLLLKGYQSDWGALLGQAEAGSEDAIGEIDRRLASLPEELSLAWLQEVDAGTFDRCRQAFPSLVRERLRRPMKIRDRARHHVGEVLRVREAGSILVGLGVMADQGTAEAGMQRLGQLLDRSHESLRDLYGVSTPEVERLREILRGGPEVCGVRLMGGGFGGNLLAQVWENGMESLISRVRAIDPARPDWDSGLEPPIRITSPGDGISGLDAEASLRTVIREFNANWRDADRLRDGVCALLDSFADSVDLTGFLPIVVAAGRGTRALRSGLEVPKPLAPVAGIPSVLRVMKSLRDGLGEFGKTILIVSPEHEELFREVAGGKEVTIAAQPQPFGTGHAVLCAAAAAESFEGTVLVVWGTQPVIRPETVRRLATLSLLFGDYAMVVPTARMRRPYAPLVRDQGGRVVASFETHQEKAEAIDDGESNIGLFAVRSEVLFAELRAIHLESWDPAINAYRRPGGEFGLPSALIPRLAARCGGVLAAPIADPREEKGIKCLADVAVCESYLRALAAAPRY